MADAKLVKAGRCYFQSEVQRKEPAEAGALSA
jgi:hypothetical protein